MPVFRRPLVPTGIKIIRFQNIVFTRLVTDGRTDGQAWPGGGMIAAVYMHTNVDIQQVTHQKLQKQVRQQDAYRQT